MEKSLIQKLKTTAQAMVANNKGLLAMDESTPTCHKRFAKLGIPETEEMRRQYRELIVTAPNLSDSISGVILFDETLHQKTKEGVPFLKIIQDAGIIPGVKVDGGAKALCEHPNEQVTEGLDGLRDRLKKYAEMGIRFAKWRAVINIDSNTLPTYSCIDVNAYTLARYAALCQEAGIVPIVEPEVLMDGEHTLERCYEVTEKVLKVTFNQLYKQRVLLEGMILKPNMVLPGLKCADQSNVQKIAEETVTCFLRTVPAAVPGVAFLSGGQDAQLASERLNEMNVQFKDKMPWGLSFSFSRAIQQPAIDCWKGDAANVAEAQKKLVHRAHCNLLARKGEYSVAADVGQ